MKPIVICAFLVIGACGPDETISGYADPNTTYTLLEINTLDVTHIATIRFPKEGQITGAGPCNTFSASQSVPYPWFSIGPIIATERACPALPQEAAFFAALGTMEFVEVTGPVLILSNSTDNQLVFHAE